MADPVQSIRIAVTLTQRFEVLAQQTASGARNVDEQELRIGEGNQIYSEIWRHLDDARAALAVQGRDVAIFDRIRADEGQQLAVDGIAISTYRGRTVRKTASFNIEGHTRANAASQALMNAMPEVDFDALRRAEDNQIASFGSLGPSRTSKVLMAMLLMAVGGIVVTFLVLYVIAASHQN